MPARDRNWRLSPLSMWRRREPEVVRDEEAEPYPYSATGRTLLGDRVDSTDDGAEEQDGVKITDRDTGRIYEVATKRIDGRLRITSFAVHATEPDDYIDRGVIRSLPLHRMAEQASLYMEDQRATGTHLVFNTGRYPEKGELTVEQVVADVGEGLKRAEMIARHNVPGSLVDERLRTARDAGLIPKATTGRPRKTTSDQGADDK